MMSPPGWWDRVVEELTDYQQRYPDNLPGAVVAAETQTDGPLLASVGANWSADTICNIGSMTKTFTATAVLLALEEAGKLDIEIPVYTLPGMGAFADEPAKRRIRVRHLLQHTSGMPPFLQYTDAPKAPCNDPHGPAPGCQDCVRDVGPTAPWLGSPGYTNECVLADGRCQPARSLSLDEVSEYLMQTYPLVHEPGVEYTYSSVNYVVAGRLVEELTGVSPNIYLKERLFGPLGMRDSFFVAGDTGDPAVDALIDEGVVAEQRSRIADVSLITRDRKWPPEVAPGPDGGWDKFRRGWRYVYPDGGMYSTAADLLAYLRMIRDDGMRGPRRIVSAAVMNLLVTDHGFGHTMAFGYRRTTTPYGQGPGTLDHLGNIMTYFWYEPRRGNPMTGVFLSQRLANALVNNNMADGMKVIFRVFVPLVCRLSQPQTAPLA
jgi:CubicO group peptidase (beta-lactamase class C family)